MSDSQETAIRTFRLDAEVIRGLEEEAERQGATVNGIACKILRKYVKIRARLEPFGVLYMTKTGMAEVVDSLDEVTVAKVAKRLGGSLAKEMLIHIYGEPSLPNFITFIDKTLCGFMGWASYTEERKKEGIEARLGHSMGEKWTVFLVNYLDSAAKEIVGKGLDFKFISRYSLIIHFPG